MSVDSAQAWRQAKFPADGIAITAHNSMAAMLRRAPGDTFALAPFAPMQANGRWYVAVCYDANDGQALMIDGMTGAMHFAEDTAQVGFWGNVNAFGDRLRIYTNGIVFARDWAAARADTLERKRRLHTAPDEALAYGDMPGLCMIGDPAAIGDFADIATAKTIEIDNPRMRRALADAMLRAARLPVVVDRPPPLKVVASNERRG